MESHLLQLLLRGDAARREALGRRASRELTRSCCHGGEHFPSLRHRRHCVRDGPEKWLQEETALEAIFLLNEVPEQVNCPRREAYDVRKAFAGKDCSIRREGAVCGRDCSQAEREFHLAPRAQSRGDGGERLRVQGCQFIGSIKSEVA